MHQNGAFPALADADEADELVEKEIRDRFKKMCEGYFDSVAKKLVIEHKVCLTCVHFSLLFTTCGGDGL